MRRPSAGPTGAASSAARSWHSPSWRPAAPCPRASWCTPSTATSCSRDGKSFCTRVVKAVQRNHAIFSMTISFHRPEWGPEFRTPGREILAVARSRGLTEGRLPTPEELMQRGVQPEPATGADNTGATETLLIARGDWWSLRYYRHKGHLPDGPLGLHEGIFAWCSDSTMAGIVCRPHQERGVIFPMVFSLDHSIHFHRPFRVDEWLLFHTRSTVSAGARGLARLEVFTLAGQLVATVTQEALARVSREVSTQELQKRREAEAAAAGSTGAQAGSNPAARL